MPTDKETQVADFMNIFLITTHEQRLAILRTITKKQCAILREVAYNLLFNDSLDISPDDRQYLKRHHISIKSLASRRVCQEKKKTIVVRKHLLIRRLAEIAVNYLR